MSNHIFTPKKNQIHVPNVGVVQKADFTQDHAKALLKRAEKYGINRDAFIKQHFEVSFGDLPLFDEEIETREKPTTLKTKKPAKVEPVKTDDELLNEMIKKEEEGKA